MSKKAVPIFDYRTDPYGVELSGPLPSGIPKMWVPKVGGGVITDPNPITFGTIMPNGERAHGGMIINGANGTNKMLQIVIICYILLVAFEAF